MNDTTHPTPDVNDDAPDLTQEVLIHISPRITRMKPNDETDCEGLFDPGVWNSVLPSERRYVFGRPVSRLVNQGKVPLEFAGFNSKRHNLYRKKKK